MKSIPRCWDCAHFEGERASEGVCRRVLGTPLSDARAWVRGVEQVAVFQPTFVVRQGECGLHGKLFEPKPVAVAPSLDAGPLFAGTA